MAERPEVTHHNRPDAHGESAQFTKQRRQKRRHQLGLVAGVLLIVAIVVGSMVLNYFAYRR